MEKKTYAKGTCGYHAQVMLALMGGKTVGPATKELVDKLMADADDQCIADESQVVFLFLQAYQKDREPAKEEAP